MSDSIKVLVSLFVGAMTGFATAWKIFVWRHDRKAHVKVEISAGILVLGGMPDDDVMLFVTATNTATTPVTISNVWLERPDVSGGLRAFLPNRQPMCTLPGIVAGRHNGQAYFRIPGLESGGFDVADKRVVGVVETPAGEEFRSLPKVVYSRS